MADRGGFLIQQVGKLELAYQRSDAVSQPIRLAPRSKSLVGRDELLAELHAKLAEGDDLWPRRAVLSGLGGAGKTSVAVEYAYRHMAEVDVAWQFAAEDPAVLAAGFGELAAQLGARELADTRDPVATVHAVLARRAAGWLMIFDNAPDIASIAAFLPPAGFGRVLITSQNPNWPGQVLNVPVLDTDVAAGFLVSRTGDQDRQTAEALARELGGLPLALEQAAAYTTATGQRLADYLALTRERRSDILSRGDTAGYGRTVATTWTLAFTQLLGSNPEAIGLLRLAAFCAPGSIPLRVLLQHRADLSEQLGSEVNAVLMPLLEDPIATSDAIAALRRYSLLTLADDGSALVHRLVQTVTADQMPTALVGQWQHATAALIEAAIPAACDRPDTWPVFAALLPHAEVALDVASEGMEEIANYLRHSGNFAAASDLMRKILAAREQTFETQHPSVIRARMNLASLTGDAGDPAGARDQYSVTLPLVEQVFGPEHLTTLVARSNLAQATSEAGDKAGARDQYTALVPVMERVLGPEHAGTLIARNNLAQATVGAGDAAGACDQYTALVPVMERVLGPEHPRTLAVRSNLAVAAGEVGDIAGARDQYTALVPVMERVLGPEHPSTLLVRSNLAQAAAEAGDATGSRDHHIALVPVMERVFGPEHPSTLTARNNLAQATSEAGDKAGARDQYTALVPVMERVLGPEHPSTLTARSNLADTTGEAGDAAGARDQYTALVPVMERVLGPEHPSTLNVRSNLAQATGEAGDAAGARNQYTALMPVVQRVLGPKHPKTLHARGNLAHWIGSAGDAARASNQFGALLPIFAQVLGPKHPRTMAVRSSITYWSNMAKGGRMRWSTKRRRTRRPK